MSNTGLADDAAITNTWPGRIALDTSVIENASAGTVVESLNNRFPELIHFRLLSERRPLPFQLTRDGELTVTNPDRLNFEERRLWVLTVKARAPRTADRYLEDFMQSLAESSGDSKVLELEELRYQDLILSIRVQVTDQEESPRVSDASIAINSDSNLKKLGRIVPSERDLDDALTYSIKCSTSDALHVDAKTGVISVVHLDRFDWTKNRHAIEIEVTDSHGNAERSVIEFTVTKPKVAPTLAPAQVADSSKTANAPSPAVDTIVPDAAPNNTAPQTPPVASLPAASLPAAERSVAQNLKTPEADKTAPGGQNSSKTDGENLSDNSHDSGSRPPGPSSVETPRINDGINSIKSAATEGTGSDANLNEAARTINSAADSSTALNDVTPASARLREGFKPTPASLRPTSDANGNSLQQPLPRASVRPLQLLLLMASLAAGGFVVYRKYKKARQERLEALKQASSDSEARLDMYMNAQNRSGEESVTEETPHAESITPAKSITNVLPPDTDLDPGAPFDPESLIDESMLAEDLQRSSEVVVASAIEDSSDPELFVQQASAGAPLPSPASPFVLLGESFLADETLAPPPAEREQLVFESLQSQLDKINEKFDALNIESDAPRESFSELQADEDNNPADSGRIPKSTSDGIASKSAEHPPVTDFSGNAHQAAEDVLPEATSESSATDDFFEPAYELQWDPEIQRYVKVEKTTASDVRQDNGYSPDARHSSNKFDSTTAPSNSDDAHSTAIDFTSSEASVACIDDATETDDQPSERVMSLRAELADLFNLHVATTSQNQTLINESATSYDPQQDAAVAEETSAEESHLDSVAKYLSQLLERSRKEDSADIFVERRGDTAGKWDGVDRRQKPKPVVKSYIESYLEQHGGQLNEDIEELSQRTTDPAAPIEEPRPVRERKPMDVAMVRRNMESFRAVAERSVETAMAAYKVRQAKGRLVGRSMLITGLIVVVGLGIGTNVFRTFHLEPLNWLMCAFILLCVVEFFLRVESIRKHRREMRLRILSAQKPVHKHVESDNPETDMLQTEPLPDVASASE